MYVLRSFGALLALTLTLSLPAQPYSLDWNREAWIGGAGLAVMAADLGLNLSMRPLTENQIAQLNDRTIPWLDRVAVYRSSPAAGLRSDIAQWSAFTMTGVVAGGLLLRSWRQDDHPAFFREGFVLATLLIETNLLALDGTYLLKGSVRRPRPYVFNPDVPPERKRSAEDRRSFFSGHTSLAAANSFFAATVFSDYFPESKWKPLVWGLAIGIPAWTGVERCLAGKHFPTDVLSGYAFGAFCGWLVPRLHRGPGRLQVYPAPFRVELDF